jgi:hypothetical protein
MSATDSGPATPPHAGAVAAGADWLLAQVPTAVEDRLRDAYAYLLPLRGIRVPLARLHGVTRSSGRQASMLVAGAERWSRYLPERFFAETPRHEALGHVALWRLPGLLRRLRESADLTVVRVDRLSARLLFDGDYLCVPEWIGTRLRLPIDVAALARRRNSVAEDVRKARRSGMTANVSREPADFATFYHRLFIPYTVARHGRDAHLAGFHRLQRSFRLGGILWVLRDGVPVAGNLFEQRGGTLILQAIGVTEGDIAWRQRGAISALYVHTIAHAQRSGCTMIDMRGARPSLTNGLLRYKAKWGGELYDKRDGAHSWLVHWNRLDGAAAEFLAHSPLAFRTGETFCGVAVADPARPWTTAAVQQARDRLWVSGLEQLCLVGSAQHADDVSIPAGTRLVDHEQLRSAGPRALLAALAAQ